MYEYCIIGAGVTGLSLLLLLQEADADLSKIAIVDPYFDGGDLNRLWTSVLSNTPWSKTADALRAALPRLTAAHAPLFSRFEPDASTALADLARLLRDLAADALRRVGLRVQAQATRARRDGATWSVELAGAGPAIAARKLLLAPGGTPRTLDIPLSSIPLDIALDPARLKRYVTPGQRVIVFGTMHSGTLVIRNLAGDCGAKVTAFYKDAAPFTWDRDGAYDGLKREAADIADALTRGDYGNSVALRPADDVGALARAVLSGDWVVYAMGFQPRLLPLEVDGAQVSATAYDGDTGALAQAPQAWGFGTAYPNRAPDRVHWDVSIAAFLSHMRAQLPALLAP